MYKDIFCLILVTVASVVLFYVLVYWYATEYKVHIEMTINNRKDYKLISFAEFKAHLEKYYNELYLEPILHGSIFAKDDKVAIHANMFLIEDKKVMADCYSEYLEMEVFKKNLYNSLKVLKK